MVKMLHHVVCDLRQGAVISSEAEVPHILWVLEEMPVYQSADEEVSKPKAAKSRKRNLRSLTKVFQKVFEER